MHASLHRLMKKSAVYICFLKRTRQLYYSIFLYPTVVKLKLEAISLSQLRQFLILLHIRLIRQTVVGSTVTSRYLMIK